MHHLVFTAIGCYMWIPLQLFRPYQLPCWLVTPFARPNRSAALLARQMFSARQLTAHCEVVKKTGTNLAVARPWPYAPIYFCSHGGKFCASFFLWQRRASHTMNSGLKAKGAPSQPCRAHCILVR